MTHAEKIRLARARELAELRAAVNRFDQAIADSHVAASDARQSLFRLEKIDQEEEELDGKINTLDKLMRRGEYAPKCVADMTMDELVRFNGGA